MIKFRELQEEFRAVFSGKRSGWIDSLGPVLVFAVVLPFLGQNAGLVAAVVASVLIALWRIVQQQSLWYALGGLAGVGIAALFLNITESEAGFFFPGLISGSATVLLCLVSLLFKRPIAAWSSFLTRRWPREWYWHPRVRPAYSEVTIFWAAAFGFRLALEFWLFQREAVSGLAAVRIFLGWPFIILLLAGSYLYGIWRLGRLGGPSVEEFKAGKEPPWKGQRRGF